MDSEIRSLLLGVQQGSLSVDEALLRLKQKPFEDIGYAKVDLHRRVRWIRLMDYQIHRREAPRN